MHRRNMVRTPPPPDAITRRHPTNTHLFLHTNGVRWKDAGPDQQGDGSPVHRGPIVKDVPELVRVELFDGHFLRNVGHELHRDDTRPRHDHIAPTAELLLDGFKECAALRQRLPRVVDDARHGEARCRNHVVIRDLLGGATTDVAAKASHRDAALTDGYGGAADHHDPFGGRLIDEFIVRLGLSKSNRPSPRAFLVRLTLNHRDLNSACEAGITLNRLLHKVRRDAPTNDDDLRGHVVQGPTRSRRQCDLVCMAPR